MNENLINNLISFRRQRNISTKELANVLGMTEDEYMKFEYGIENPTLEVLKKLGSFYGVEPASFFVMQPASFFVMQPANYSGKQVKANQYGQMNGQLLNQGQYTYSKAMGIILLILAVAFFIFASLEFYNVSISMQYFDQYQTFTQSASLYELFNADALYIIMLVLLILVAVWDIVDNILLLSGKWSRGKYSNVSKIFKLISAGISVIAYAVITIGILNDSSVSQSVGSVGVSAGVSLNLGWYILLAELIVVVIIKIIAFVKTKKVG